MKKSTVRVYVAVTALLSSLLELATRLVQLFIALVSWAIARVERAPHAHASKKTSVIADAAPTPKSAEQLTAALVGLGFKRPEVTRFVTGVGVRADKEPMADLVKEGLRALAS
jgi:Holliday junction resolvasome RuvABC DNA-binding subunit